MRKKLIELRESEQLTRDDFGAISRSKLWKIEMGQDDFSVSVGAIIAQKLCVEYDQEGYFAEGKKDKLRKIIDERDIKIGEMARDTNLSRTALYYLFSGKREPFYSTARKVADYVGIPFDEGGVFVDDSSDNAEEQG